MTQDPNRAPQTDPELRDLREIHGVERLDLELELSHILCEECAVQYVAQELKCDPETVDRPKIKRLLERADYNWVDAGIVYILGQVK